VADLGTGATGAPPPSQRSNSHLAIYEHYCIVLFSLSKCCYTLRSLLYFCDIVKLHVAFFFLRYHLWWIKMNIVKFTGAPGELCSDERLRVQHYSCVLAAAVYGVLRPSTDVARRRRRLTAIERVRRSQKSLLYFSSVLTDAVNRRRRLSHSTNSEVG